jgi:LuxR family maltose regulon positive regulatory protein
MEHDVGSGSQALEPILRTKLHRPQLNAELVSRDRLIKVMDHAGEVPLTLVSAPAGYGKSVLAAQWVEQLDNPVAWFSVDASDSELRVFLQYFFAAVDTVSPGACDATRELLAAGSLAPVPVLAGYLLNDLDAMAPCAIVLDDYHRIEPLSPVHELMIRMLEHPPAQFRLVVASRQDPSFDLPSLRAAHRINEVRLQDLRFTGHETSEFLSATTDISVSDEALAHLEREVEGWAAGLRLVSLALRHVRDADAFLERLTGRLPQVQEYLLREVLAAQAAEVRDRMLASSILDRFCAGVLDAVCEPPDTDDQAGLTAADFMKELSKSNLFTVSLDARREWIRYHNLFQELLVSELQRLRGPDHVAALHLRASQWFEGEGLIDEALKHALAAEDVERAAELIARHRHDALNADQWYVLANWLALIPEATVQRHAELLMARAWIVLNYHFRVEAVPPLLDEIESLLGNEPGNEQVRGELAVSRGYIFWLMGNGAESLQHLAVALERIPVSHVDFRSNAENVFAQANQMVGRKQQGIRFLDDLLAHPDLPQEMRKTRLLAARVFIHLTAGDLLEAEMANRRLWTVVERGGSAYVRAWTSYVQGLLYLQRCEWEAAVEYLGHSVAQRFIHHARAAVDSMTGLMLAYQALGQKDEAQAALQTLSGYVASLDDPAMESLVVSAEARLAILQGRLGTARRWLEATEPPPGGALLWWIDIPSITRCRAIIAAGSPGGFLKAEAQLKECAEVIEAQHNICQLIRVLTLMATACARQGKTDEALGTLERAVTLARQGDLVLPFVELGTSWALPW